MLYYETDGIVIYYTEAATRGVPLKKMFLEISQNSQENNCARVSSLIKLQACSFIKKETLAQVFSCKFFEISKNTFFTEHIWTTASDYEKSIFPMKGYIN